LRRGDQSEALSIAVTELQPYLHLHQSAPSAVEAASAAAKSDEARGAVAPASLRSTPRGAAQLPALASAAAAGLAVARGASDGARGAPSGAGSAGEGSSSSNRGDSGSAQGKGINLLSAARLAQRLHASVVACADLGALTRTMPLIQAVMALFAHPALPDSDEDSAADGAGASVRAGDKHARAVDAGTDQVNHAQLRAPPHVPSHLAWLFEPSLRDMLADTVNAAVLEHAFAAAASERYAQLCRQLFPAYFKAKRQRRATSASQGVDARSARTSPPSAAPGPGEAAAGHTGSATVASDSGVGRKRARSASGAGAAATATGISPDAARSSPAPPAAPASGATTARSSSRGGTPSPRDAAAAAAEPRGAAAGTRGSRGSSRGRRSRRVLDGLLPAAQGSDATAGQTSTSSAAPASSAEAAAMSVSGSAASTAAPTGAQRELTQPPRQPHGGAATVTGFSFNVATGLPEFLLVSAAGYSDSSDADSSDSGERSGAEGGGRGDGHGGRGTARSAAEAAGRLGRASRHGRSAPGVTASTARFGGRQRGHSATGDVRGGSASRSQSHGRAGTSSQTAPHIASPAGGTSRTSPAALASRRATAAGPAPVVSPAAAPSLLRVPGDTRYDRTGVLRLPLPSGFGLSTEVQMASGRRREARRLARRKHGPSAGASAGAGPGNIAEAARPASAAAATGLRRRDSRSRSRSRQRRGGAGGEGIAEGASRRPDSSPARGGGGASYGGRGRAASEGGSGGGGGGGLRDPLTSFLATLRYAFLGSPPSPPSTLASAAPAGGSRLRVYRSRWRDVTEGGSGDESVEEEGEDESEGEGTAGEGGEAGEHSGDASGDASASESGSEGGEEEDAGGPADYGEEAAEGDAIGGSSAAGGAGVGIAMDVEEEEGEGDDDDEESQVGQLMAAAYAALAGGPLRRQPAALHLRGRGSVRGTVGAGRVPLAPRSPGSRLAGASAGQWMSARALRSSAVAPGSDVEGGGAGGAGEGATGSAAGDDDGSDSAGDSGASAHTSSASGSDSDGETAGSDAAAGASGREGHQHGSASRAGVRHSTSRSAPPSRGSAAGAGGGRPRGESYFDLIQAAFSPRRDRVASGASGGPAGTGRHFRASAASRGDGSSHAGGSGTSTAGGVREALGPGRFAHFPSGLAGAGTGAAAFGGPVPGASSGAGSTGGRPWVPTGSARHDASAAGQERRSRVAQVLSRLLGHSCALSSSSSDDSDGGRGPVTAPSRYPSGRPVPAVSRSSAQDAGETKAAGATGSARHGRTRPRGAHGRAPRPPPVDPSATLTTTAGLAPAAAGYDRLLQQLAGGGATSVCPISPSARDGGVNIGGDSGGFCYPPSFFYGVGAERIAMPSLLESCLRRTLGLRMQAAARGAGSVVSTAAVAAATGAAGVDGAANPDVATSVLQEAAQEELATLLAEALQLSAGMSR
jgi:hypothetical protein